MAATLCGFRDPLNTFSCLVKLHMNVVGIVTWFRKCDLEGHKIGRDVFAPLA